MLKFEGKFQVGDIIRAYDFPPVFDREDCYIIVRIDRIADDFSEVPFKAYVGEVLRDTCHERGGETAYVPMEVGFIEFDERISLVSGEDSITRFPLQIGKGV